jgi:hypothetical protein
MERALHIEVLGKLWMPGVMASTVLDVSIGEGPFQEQFDNPTDADEVWRYVDTHSGDFSQVIAINATYCESSTTLDSVQVSGDQVYRESRTVSREVHVVTFTDEQEEQYADTLNDWYDDEQEAYA